MTQRRPIGFGPSLALTIASALSLSACGVMFGGTTKNISVASTPSAARVTTEPLTGSYTTPTMLNLERKKSYTLVVWKDGYQETQFPIQRKIRVVPLIGDIVLGLVGVIVDAATGGWWDLQPEVATVVLDPLDEASGLQPIAVTISAAESGAGALSVDASEAVNLRLIQN